MKIIEHRDNNTCKKYKYIGGHIINDKKLTIGMTYYIRENNWGSPCIIDECNQISWVLSKLALNTLFKEVNQYD